MTRRKQAIEIARKHDALPQAGTTAEKCVLAAIEEGIALGEARVPREPTETMLRAGYAKMYMGMELRDSAFAEAKLIAEAWQDMHDAAPAAASKEPARPEPAADDPVVVNLTTMAKQAAEVLPNEIRFVCRQAANRIATLSAENANAYSTLAIYGVPQKRAKTIANGIAVLVTRMDREIADLRAAQAASEADRRDAEMWRFIATLWTAYAITTLRQDEDGRWSITGIDGDECADYHLAGDDPEQVIDAAIARQKGEG